MTRRRTGPPRGPSLPTDLSVGEVLRLVRGEGDDEVSLDALLSQPSIDALFAEEEDEPLETGAPARAHGDREGSFPKRIACPRSAPPDAPGDVAVWAAAIGGDAFLDDPIDALSVFVDDFFLRSLKHELGRSAPLRRLLRRRGVPPRGPHGRGWDAVFEAIAAHVLARLERAALERRRAQTLAARPDGETASRLSFALAALVERLREDPEALAEFPCARAEFRIAEGGSALAVRFKRATSSWADVVVHVGLWPDAPEEMFLRCSCGGSVAAPCPHARTAAEWTRDLVHDPEEPGHRRTLEAIERSHAARSAALVGEILARRAVRLDPEERIAWRLPEDLSGGAVAAFVQKRTAKGGWSSGRARRPLDLATNPELDRLCDVHDRAALHAIALASLAPDRDDRDDAGAAVVEALIGHPRVFFGEGRSARPVAVVREHARLTLAPAEEAFRLAVQVGEELLTIGQTAHALVGPRHIVRLDGAAGTCRVARLSETAIEAMEALAGLPSLLPRLEAMALLDSIARSGAAVELALPPSMCEASRAGDPRCRVALAPLGAVPLLGVSLIVRPLDDDLAFPPGDGPEEIVRGIDGVLTLARRRFEAELAEAEDISRALGVGGLEGHGSWSWQTVTLEQSLAIVEAARTLGDRVAIEWPKGAKPWSVRKVDAAGLKLEVKRRTDWFGVGAEVRVDGVAISLEALLEAARRKRRYVDLGRGRFAALEEGLRAAISRIDDLAFEADEEELRLDTAAAVVLAGLEADGAVGVAGDKGWRAFVARLDSLGREEPRLPSGFVGSLRDYQERGFSWLVRLAEWGAGACLADDMGLGKTVQALALLLHRAGRGPALVVAPTSVMSGWMVQARSFAPSLDARLFHGATRAGALEHLGAGSLLVTSYDVLASEIDALERIPFATLVIDEAQMIKNAATQRARAIVRMDAEARVALTGTPIENHLGELWSVFRVLNPGLLGSLARFKERFAIPIERHGDGARREGLARLLKPFILRRTKAAVAPELPPRVETIRTVELSETERLRYEAVRREAIERALRVDADDPKGRFHVLAAITRLRRLACHPRLDDPATTAGSAKLAAAVELLEDLHADGQRALVFSQFTGHLALLREALDARRRGYLYLDGSTPAAERARLVDEWAGGRPTLFLISLKAGGTGLNLMGADMVLHLDPWWNPAVEDQATDRTHRIGQTKPVTVVRLIAADTIEEAVVALHARKRDLARGLLEGADAAGALSTRDLIGLIRDGEA
jgi:superfamily II DNA or RNA helicase